jgi:hypothetical protein
MISTLVGDPYLRKGMWLWGMLSGTKIARNGHRLLTILTGWSVSINNFVLKLRLIGCLLGPEGALIFGTKIKL